MNTRPAHDPKKFRIPIEPFQWEANDPLAAEHQIISQFTIETLAGGWRYGDFDFHSVDGGQKITEADTETSVRLVSALVARTIYFDELVEKIKALEKTEWERLNIHNSPEWEAVWPSRKLSSDILKRVMRRKLPLSPRQLIQIADWIASAPDQWLGDTFYPVKSFVKALENYGSIDRNDAALQTPLVRISQRLGKHYSKDLPKLARQIDLILNPAPSAGENLPDESPAQQPSAGPDASVPAPAGSPNVLVRLKQFLKILPEDNITSTETGFDHFQLRSDSPLSEEHELINRLLPEVIEQTGYDRRALALKATGRIMLERDDPGRSKVLLAAAERTVNAHFVPGGGLGDHRCWQSQSAVRGVFQSLLKTKPKLERKDLFDVLLFFSAQPDIVGLLIWNSLDRCY